MRRDKMVEIMNSKVIAIDGPSGSGKSTIAKMVASQLELTYLDTGAMFRALGLILDNSAIDIHQDGLDAVEMSEVGKILSNINFEYNVDVKTLIKIDGVDLTQKIREHHVSSLASKVSKFAVVRQYLKDMQRQIAGSNPSVLEGRDIGTVVFPDAALKVFLTAKSSVRAQRRYDQLIAQDSANAQKYNVEQIKNDIEQRDIQDQQRAIAPLLKADDAIELDTSDLSIEEVKNKIIELYEKRIHLFS